MALKLTTEEDTLPQTEGEADALAEQELAAFSQYMCSGEVQDGVRGPLMRVERGILKTYLMAKLNGRLDR